MTDTPPRVRDLRCAPLNRVCIVMMSAAGDAVHVLPVVNALKRARPHCHISWVLQPGPASLVRGHAAVDEIILFERARGWRAFHDVRRTLAGRSFDLVLGLQVYIKGGLVTWLANAPIKLGFDRERARDFNWLFTTHRIPAHPPQHVQDQYFEFLAALGVPHEPVEWGLGPWPHERAWQQEFFADIDRPVAVLVPGSSAQQREWLPERWAAVATLLSADYGLQPVLAGGRSARELEAEQTILSQARARVISTLGIPLRQLVGVLDGCALVISVNTGPLHMAVALDRPVISLMGHNNPKRVGPYRRFHDLIVDAYGELGEDYPVSMQHRPNRMRRISVEDVVEKIDLWSRRYADAAALRHVRAPVGPSDAAAAPSE
jgi:heptosyltransferase I